MHTMQRLTLSLFLLLAGSLRAQQTPNPLLIHSNAPIAFDKVSVRVIRDAADSVIWLSDARIKKIARVPAAGRVFANTLSGMDALQYELYDLIAKIYLISATYADDSIRNTATETMSRLQVYANNLTLNEGLYKALTGLARSPEAKQLRPDQQKYLADNILAFEMNGMKLDAAGRKELAALNEKLVELGNQFDKNIAESKDSLRFSATDLQGVDSAMMAAWKTADGSYLVRLTPPARVEIMRNAVSDSTRHMMYLHDNNRAYPANIGVLDSLYYYRQVFANKIGFKSFAAYSVVNKMAGSTAAVWKFEYDLASKLSPHVTQELNELRELKHQLHPELPDTIFAWDVPYYQKKLLDTKYQLNADEVKQYFEMNNTIRGMFNVYEKLFNIRIKEVNNRPVWDPKVRCFEMYSEEKKIGNFYFDLYPRPNKYNHFECTPISQYRRSKDKEVLPVAVLICNFPEGSADHPSLLIHYDVETLFHEFGHLVHFLLGRPAIASQNSFAVKGDFVEAPSQFLENWCWEYPSLKMLGKHYKTGEVLPENLFHKIKQTQLVGISITYSRQLYYGMVDFTYADKYDSIKNIGLVQVSEDLSPITQIPFVEGTHMICNFSHLNGYGANYYGYLWSKVFAQDLFSVFRKNGIMDTPTGIRYRKTILEKAASVPEMDLLTQFLGRKPDSDAFLESLGIR